MGKNPNYAARSICVLGGTDCRY